MDPKLNEDEPEIRKRTRTLHKKFPEIEKIEEITEDIFLQLIEKMNLSNKIDKFMAKNLFHDLDTQKTGKIPKEKFIDYLNINSSSNKANKGFYETINEQLYSKSEKIIMKLKQLKDKEYIKNDISTLNDINWIITEIAESDIHEPEYLTLNQLKNEAFKSGNVDNKNAVEYLSQFSKYWDHSRKEADLKKINTTRSFKSISLLKRQHTLSADHSSLSEEFEKERNRNDSKRGSVILESISSNPSSAILMANILSKIDSSEFNIFELDALIKRKTVFIIANEIFDRYQFLDMIDEEKFKEFISQIILGYNREVTYHNDLHAGDVLQTLFVLLFNSDFDQQLKLQDIDLISAFLSAIIHDFKHPGFNNMFQINAKSKIAIRYNDASVLESYHVSQAFKIMLKPGCNLLAHFAPEEFRTMRRRMIECVLATDMANHSRHVATFKSKLDSCDINNGKNVERIISDVDAKNFESQQMVLSNLLHAADISNPVKPEKVYDVWIDLLFQEFFKQGDYEKSHSLPVSLMCDRYTTNIEKSQVGFINFIVSPLWDLVYRITPQSLPYIENIKANQKRFEEKVKNQDKK